MLVVCAVGDGNFALNTNPMPDGQIEPRQVENFRKIGAWLEKYGESIYGTRGGPFVAPDGRSASSTADTAAISPSPGGAWWGGSDAQRQHHLPAHPPLADRHDHLTGDPATHRQTHRPHRRRSDRETNRHRHRSHRRPPPSATPPTRSSNSNSTPPPWTSRHSSARHRSWLAGVRQNSHRLELFQKRSEYGPTKQWTAIPRHAGAATSGHTRAGWKWILARSRHSPARSISEP